MKFNCAHTNIVELHKLTPNPKNPNRHTAEQIERLAKIIDFQGQRAPIVVSKRSGFIVKGHCRLEALKTLGWEKAAVDYQDYPDEATEFADMTADNEIARWATLDKRSVVDNIKDIGLENLDIDVLGLEVFDLHLLDTELDEIKTETNDENAETFKKFLLLVEFLDQEDMELVKREMKERGYPAEEK